MSDKGKTEAVREQRVANLAPYRFQPGQSGNPSGRPKNVLSKALRKKLEELDGEGEEARSNAELIASKLVELAIGGSIEAARLIGDRVEGRARQPVTLTTDSRDRVERAVEGLVEKARSAGDDLPREAALALLAEMGDETAAAMLGDE